MEVNKSLHVIFDTGDIHNLFFKHSAKLLTGTFSGRGLSLIEDLIRNDSFNVCIAQRGDSFILYAEGKVNLVPTEIQSVISGEILTEMPFKFSFPKDVAVGLLMEEVLRKENLTRTEDMTTPVRNLQFTCGHCAQLEPPVKISFDFSIIPGE